MTRAVRVAYVVSRYPSASHTFIRREINALRQRGVVVDTFSVRRPSRDEHAWEDDHREFTNTWYIRPVPWGAGLMAHALAFGSHPARYLATCREAVRHRVPGWKAFRVSLLAFIEAILLAIELRHRGHVHVHSHGAMDGGILGYLATRYLGISWSVTLHGISDVESVSNELLPAKVRAAAFVACVSHFARAQAMRAVDPELWSRLCVIRCGVDFDTLPARPASNHRARLRIVCVGRLTHEKAHLGLLSAFRTVIERGARAELRLIGGGPQEARLREEIGRQGLASHCSLLGRLPEPATLREIADADVLVLSSFMEGLPVVLMEAMSLSVPVVAPCIAGIPELVEHGRTGLLFSPARWDELTDQIIAVLDDGELRGRLGEAGRARVEDEFDVANAVVPLHDRFVLQMPAG